jgi:hypothetical protein
LADPPLHSDAGAKGEVNSTMQQTFDSAQTLDSA